MISMQIIENTVDMQPEIYMQFEIYDHDLGNQPHQYLQRLQRIFNTKSNIKIGLSLAFYFDADDHHEQYMFYTDLYCEILRLIKDNANKVIHCEFAISDSLIPLRACETIFNTFRNWEQTLDFSINGIVIADNNLQTLNRINSIQIYKYIITRLLTSVKGVLHCDLHNPYGVETYNYMLELQHLFQHCQCKPKSKFGLQHFYSNPEYSIIYWKEVLRYTEYLPKNCTVSFAGVNSINDHSAKALCHVLCQLIKGNFNIKLPQNLTVALHYGSLVMPEYEKLLNTMYTIKKENSQNRPYFLEMNDYQLLTTHRNTLNGLKIIFKDNVSDGDPAVDNAIEVDMQQKCVQAYEKAKNLFILPPDHFFGVNDLSPQIVMRHNQSHMTQEQLPLLIARMYIILTKGDCNFVSFDLVKYILNFIGIMPARSGMMIESVFNKVQSIISNRNLHHRLGIESQSTKKRKHISEIDFKINKRVKLQKK